MQLKGQHRGRVEIQPLLSASSCGMMAQDLNVVIVMRALKRRLPADTSDRLLLTGDLSNPRAVGEPAIAVGDFTDAPKRDL